MFLLRSRGASPLRLQCGMISPAAQGENKPSEGKRSTALGNRSAAHKGLMDLLEEHAHPIGETNGNFANIE
jgi:hypothetical protein